MNTVQCLIIDLTKFNSHFWHLFSKTPIQGLPPFKVQKACPPDKP
jgi:hypothetical protein